MILSIAHAPPPTPKIFACLRYVAFRIDTAKVEVEVPKQQQQQAARTQRPFVSGARRIERTVVQTERGNIPRSIHPSPGLPFTSPLTSGGSCGSGSGTSTIGDELARTRKMAHHVTSNSRTTHEGGFNVVVVPVRTRPYTGRR